jgi:hypothetical protein
MWNRISFVLFPLLIFTFHFNSGKCQLPNLPLTGYLESYAFDLELEDTAFTNKVFLLYDSVDVPYSYSATISTAVCDDGLCQHLQIKLFWDLIGNYAAFDTLSGIPLTKYDHLPFTIEDYTKLHEILRDQNSVLERKSIDELFDREKTRISQTVDAITGATAEAVKNAIVAGALYSTYKLWHIANGSIKSQIQAYTQSIYDNSIQKKLLDSPGYEQQLFALKMFKDVDFENQFEAVLKLLKSGNPLVEMVILKMVSPSIWGDDYYRKFIVISFKELSVNGRSILLNKISALEKVSTEELRILCDHLELMNNSQLKIFLEVLSKQKDQIDGRILEILNNVVFNNGNNAYYVAQFLHKYQ